MIKAFTFESTNTESTQLQPYDAKTDARVRRDMFLGHGDVIATGDKNGQLNAGDVTLSKDGATFTVASHVVFIAGGRMFSMTDESVTIPVKPINGSRQDTYLGSLFVEISANGPEYVKINNTLTEVPATNNYDADNYVSKFDIIITKPNGKYMAYAAIYNNAQYAAGGTFDISNLGKTMQGTPAPWRGQFVMHDDLRLTNNNGHITIVGTIREFDAANNLNIINTDGLMSLIRDNDNNNVWLGKIIIIGDRFTGSGFAVPGDGNNFIKLENYRQSASTTGKQSNVYVIIELDGYKLKYNTK